MVLSKLLKCSHTTSKASLCSPIQGKFVIAICSILDYQSLGQAGSGLYFNNMLISIIILILIMIMILIMMNN